MTLAHQTAPTRATLVTYVRDEIRDPSTLPTGQVRADGSLKFSAAEVTRAIEQAISKLETRLALHRIGPSLRVVELTYTEDAEQACALPAALVDVGGVYKVEIVNDTGVPTLLTQVSLRDVESSMARAPAVYAFMAGAPSGTSGHPSYKIQVRPRSSVSRTLRIYYVATPVVPGADTDTVGLAARWLELVSLESALVLLSRQDEFTIQQEARRQEVLHSFEGLSGAYAGPHHIQRTRGAWR